MENSIWKNIRLFKWKSVFFRYFFSLFLIILVILVPYNLLLFQYYNYILSNEISVQSAANALQSKSIFDLLTSDFYKNYNFACDTVSVRNFLGTKKPADLSAATLSVQSFVSAMVKNTEYVDEIYIYSFENNLFVSSHGIRPAEGENAHPWLNTYMATKLPLLMFPRKLHSDTFNYLYICHEIYNTRGRVIGIFCTRIKYEDFEKIIVQSFQEEPEAIFVVSNIGLILYSDDPGMINTTMFEREDIYTAFTHAKTLEGNAIIYEDSIISVAKSANSQLMLMSYYSNNFIMRNYHYLVNIILLATISIFAAAILIALFLSFRQYYSVNQVLEITKDPDKRNGSKGKLSEFFYIADTISALSHKNEVISDKLSENMASLKKAQMAALQSQINPHFLFNTLQLINLSIIKEVKGDNQSTYLLSLLSDLLRASYDTGKYQVSVQEELENVSKYLDIQKARYCSRLQVDYEIDPDCLAYMTLRLLLQPFVENSIVHGFRGKNSDWRITVRCCRQEKNILYQITDNGTGISQPKLDQLNGDLRNARPPAGSVGTANVNQRLRLLYGGRCGVSITSDGQSWTTVTVWHDIGPEPEKESIPR